MVIICLICRPSEVDVTEIEAGTNDSNEVSWYWEDWGECGGVRVFFTRVMVRKEGRKGWFNFLLYCIDKVYLLLNLEYFCTWLIYIVGSFYFLRKLVNAFLYMFILTFLITFLTHNDNFIILIRIIDSLMLNPEYYD